MNMHDKKIQAQAILRNDPLVFFQRTLATTMPNVEYLSNWHLGAMAAAFEEVLPVAIHERLGEKRIRLAAHPICQPQPGIFIWRNRTDTVAESGRNYGLPSLDVFRTGDAASSAHRPATSGPD